MSDNGQNGTQGKQPGNDGQPETFRECVEKLELDDLNAVRKVLSLPSKNDSDKDYTAEMKTKDLSAFMAYIASFAFFAYVKPTNKTAYARFGLKENLVNGVTIQHVNKLSLTKGVKKVVRFRVTGCTLKDGATPPSLQDDPYLVLTNGTSMVKSNILEDISQPAEKSYHYLFIRMNSAENVNGFIGHKDKNKSTEGQNPPRTAFEKYPDSDELKLDLSKTHSDIGTKHLSFKCEGKEITVNFSYKVITLPDNDDAQTKNPLDDVECRWMDDIDIGRFGNRKQSWDLWVRAVSSTPTKMYPMAYIDLDSSATQAWFYWNEKEKVIVLAFPGTDMQEDYFLDTNTSNDTEEVELKANWASVSDSSDKTSQNNDTLKVHKGFYTAYLSVRDTLLAILYSITNQFNKWSIIVTGHSLGGSLATLAAYDLATITKHVNKQSNVAMFTFAAPAVGNQKMCSEFSDKVPLGFRIVAADDAVANTMHDPLERMGKVFPCKGTTPKTLNQILTTPMTSVGSRALHSNNGDCSLSGSDQCCVVSWRDLIGAIPPAQLVTHSEGNYFSAIEGFLNVVFS